MDLGVQTRIFEHTSAYQIPVIASALFDPRGFLVGIRLITDPRVDVLLRENGINLSNFLRARYGVGWVCADLPRVEGEREYQGLHEKMRCNLAVPDDGVSVMLETHNYRKPGQFAVDPRTRRATEGQFISSTLYELILLNAQDGQPRDPPTQVPGPSEQDLLVARAMNCPGCDFQGANFKARRFARREPRRGKLGRCQFPCRFPRWRDLDERKPGGRQSEPRQSEPRQPRWRQHPERHDVRRAL